MINKEKVLEYLKEKKAEIKLSEIRNVRLYLTGCLDCADWDLKDDEEWLFVINDDNDNIPQIAWNKEEALKFLDEILEGMYGQDPIQALDLAYKNILELETSNNT